MKKIILLSILVLVGIPTLQASNKYFIDHAALDIVFEQAEHLDFEPTGSLAPLVTNANLYTLQQKDPAVAFVLAWALGGLGIHRAYLGTSTGTIVGYILTAGGCGILWTIDTILLLIGLINDDITPYVDNPSFFMW